MPLLERTGRRVTLTPAGAVLVQHAETVLAALERATAALAAAGTGLSGPLRIGAFPTAVRTLLPAALVALGRDHPGLELMVTELDPVAVPDALRDRRLDVGLLHDYDVVPVEPDPTLDAVPLLDETVYLAVPAADGDSGRRPGPRRPATPPGSWAPRARSATPSRCGSAAPPASPPGAAPRRRLRHGAGAGRGRAGRVAGAAARRRRSRRPGYG